MDRYWRGVAGTAGILVLALWAVLFSRLTHAGPGACDPWIARAVSVQGTVEVQAAGTSRWLKAALDQTYCPGETVRVAANSRAAVELRNETIIRLDQNTTIVFHPIEPDEPSWLDILRGAVHFISRVPRALKVRTPYVNAAIEGTEFLVRVTQDDTAVVVFEGKVAVNNAQGSLLLGGAEAARAAKGQAPQPYTIARPRDAVQWALYYPPVTDYTQADVRGNDIVAGALRRSAARFNQGDVSGALGILAATPLGLRDARYLTHRASLLLYVGQVDEARTDLQQALTLDPVNGTALALRSIIAVAQNDRTQALQLAQQAAQTASQLAAPQIALSFAYQASFDIQKALARARKATELDPGNALAWARLAELRLSLGELDLALDAARQAVTLNPRLARTQSILGFAQLTRINLAEAMGAFEEAVRLDSASPLARLGLGLAEIRKGNLKRGRRQIEIAAILHPTNSLIRSYLGKAYFEERRADVAGEQLAMAKGLDPKDPTPWFYDAILKQTVNRPVEALEDLQRSVELNDNRAVFRSELLLDQDEAARSSSLARIFRDLRFEQRALLDGWRSVQADPGNHSGHRFLADSYSTLRRHDIARASELLQSQLLQPINVTPIQPRLGEANLFVLAGAGPAEPAFNEFNPLFTRNGVALQASGVTGSNDTVGNELAFSGIHNKLSYSLGQYHFSTDGFRDNNDVEHDIYNAFIQFTPSFRTSLQAEYRFRETDSGDLRLRFDPDDFDPTERRDLRRKTARVGLRHSPTPHSDIIGSLIYRDSRSRFKNKFEVDALPFFSLMTNNSVDEDGEAYSGELQYLHRMRWLNLIAGAGHFDEDRTFTSRIEGQESSLEFVGFPIFNFVTVTSGIDETTEDEIDPDHTNAYLYSHIKPHRDLTLTAGLAYDDYHSEFSDHERFNPKLGLVWESPYGTTVRAAWFKTMKRPFASNQTIEPTHVAGFNQFFDDLNGIRTTRYGAAVEQRFTSSLFAGAEASWRDLKGVQDQDEQLHRAYAYWAPTERLAFNAEYFLEDFDIDDKVRTIPIDLRTHRVPLGMSLYWPNGFIAQLQASYVRQGITQNDVSDHDQFWVVDASIGFRLPKRWGILRVTSTNILDKQFNYYDINFNSSEPQIPLFQPERQIFAHLTLAF